jgi:ABC-2 type transport system ATP-binding protein
MDHVLAVSGLSIAYGDFLAVDSVSFSVTKGEIFGLLGPNGAGKTSTLSAIEGLSEPKEGSVVIAGFDILKEPLRARANLGVQLQSTSFQQELTLDEVLRLYSGLYAAPISTDEATAALDSLKLLDHRKKPVKLLSGGQQQRFALFIATLHQPPLLLLDEPTTGLDPQSRRQLWERIETMRDNGQSIVLTTHSMEEASAVCDRVAIMDHGRVVATDHPMALVETYKNDPAVLAASRRGVVTLEDVFIGLTGKEVRT